MFRLIPSHRIVHYNSPLQRTSQGLASLPLCQVPSPCREEFPNFCRKLPFLLCMLNAGGFLAMRFVRFIYKALFIATWVLFFSYVGGRPQKNMNPLFYGLLLLSLASPSSASRSALSP